MDLCPLGMLNFFKDGLVVKESSKTCQWCLFFTDFNTMYNIHIIMPLCVFLEMSPSAQPKNIQTINICQESWNRRGLRV